MAAIQDGPNAIKQAAIKTDFPVDEGLTGGTQTQTGRITNLVVQEKSLVSERVRRGLNGR